MKRSIFKVIAANEMWQVVVDGHVSSTHMTKDAAFTKARHRAIQKLPSSLAVYREDGTVESKWDYGDDLSQLRSKLLDKH